MELKRYIDEHFNETLDNIIKIINIRTVKGEKSLEEAAGQIRTAEISKEEGIQRTKDAISQLDADYKTEMKNMILHQSKLSEKLNNSFKLEPGKLEAKARSSKKKMEEAQAAGKTAVAEAHKKNALMYLSQKSKALERIAKTEKTLQDLEVNIELASAAGCHPEESRHRTGAR